MAKKKSVSIPKGHKKMGCGLTKTEAKKKAVGVRSKGKTSRVVKNDGKGWCYTTGPKRKK